MYGLDVKDVMSHNGSLHSRVLRVLLTSHLAELDTSGMKPLDCVQWIIDSNPKREPWPPEKIIQAVLGLWFASVHQPAIQLVYAIDALCKHQQYIEP